MWLDNLKVMKDESGLSTREIAARSNLPEPTLEKIFSGATKDPKLTTIQQLVHFLGHTLDDLDDKPKIAKKESPSDLPEEALKIAKDYSKLDERGKGAVKAILEYEGKSAAESTPKQTAARPKVVTLPKVKRSHDFTEVEVFDQPAAAGLGNQIDAPPSHVEQYPSDYVPTKTNFGVLISGDSMEPKIPNGSTVFVQATPVLDNGEIGIFVLDGKAYCKQLKKDAETQQVKLHSLNPEYEDIEIPPFAELRTLGRVLGGYDPQTRDVI